MKKISTLFKKDPSDLGRVINEINPENKWALSTGIATRKYDGTACAVINGELYKRYDVKRGKTVPNGAIPCQAPDEITGHWPHWVKCDSSNKADKWHIEAFGNEYQNIVFGDGTYELIGEKIQGNPEKIGGHVLVEHGKDILNLPDRSFDGIKEYLTNNDIEGIVFHANDLSGRMCKIRKSDFGIKRNN